MEYFNYIFDSITYAQIGAFYTFAMIGILFNYVIHYKRRSYKLNNQKFIFSYWIKDNIIRFLTNILVLFIILRFKQFLPLEEINLFWLGLLSGISIDIIIINLRKYSKINIFQIKK